MNQNNKIFIAVEEDHVFLEVVFRDGSRRGSFMYEIHPGQEFKGYSYEELRGMGNGMHDFKSRLKQESKVAS